MMPLFLKQLQTKKAEAEAQGTKIDDDIFSISNIDFSDGENAKCMNNSKIIATVSMSEPSIANAIEEAEISEAIFAKKQDVTYDSDVKFFNYFQEEIGSKIGSIRYDYYKTKLLEKSITINSMWVLIAILGFVCGFAISLGPITWALLSEIFPSSVRGLGISVAGTLNGITSFVVVTIFPLELAALGSSMTYLIYAVLLVICLIMVISIFPETKGKSLEEIEAELVKE
jgi:hypothetical protein